MFSNDTSARVVVTRFGARPVSETKREPVGHICWDISLVLPTPQGASSTSVQMVPYPSLFCTYGFTES